LKLPVPTTHNAQPATCNQRFFVTAIGTDCGKTLVSAILCEALKADYWKPVQTGGHSEDADTVSDLVSYPIHIHPETYCLSKPVSPHLAAQIEGLEIQITDFQLPITKNHLIVEGAGGILVPLNAKGDFVIDIAKKLDLEVVLVVRLYLGCINHALLSIQELKRRGISIKGIVFNGDDTFGAIDLITSLEKLPVLFLIPDLATIDKTAVAKLASKIKLS
jgi:dethiobiotin synthetase